MLFLPVLYPLSKKLPFVKKVVYFSDGAASQYKNDKAFINRCFHQQDHNLKAESNFLATNHGKSLCDGVGGTVKRLVANSSLKANHDNCILAPKPLYEWGAKIIKAIFLFYVSSETVRENSLKYNLDKHYSLANTVDGTRSHHSFIPTSCSTIEIIWVSSDEIFSNVSFGATSGDISEFQPGKYVACLYDERSYIGTIVECSSQNNDV